MYNKKEETVRDILDSSSKPHNNEQQIKQLFGIIDTELNKPEAEADQDLIKECSDYIGELMPDDELHSEQELLLKLDQVKAMAEASSADESRHSAKKGKAKRIVWKAVAILAATMVVMFATLSVAAIKNGYNSAWEYLDAKISEVLDMKFYESTTENGITFIRNGKSKKYDSIEELLNKEDLIIMYPTVLPDKIHIKKILIVPRDESRYTIAFHLSSNDISISITNYYQKDISDSPNHSNYISSDGHNFVIIPKENGIYQAMCQYNGFEYIIQAPSTDWLILIIENIKEIKT